MEPFALLQTLRVPYFPRVASNFRSNGNNPARAVQRIILINKVNARFSLPFQLPPVFPYYPTFRKTSSSKQFTNHPLKKKDLSPTLSSIKIYIIRNIHSRSSDKEWYDWIKSVISCHIVPIKFSNNSIVSDYELFRGHSSSFHIVHSRLNEGRLARKRTWAIHEWNYMQTSGSRNTQSGARNNFAKHGGERGNEQLIAEARTDPV